MFNLGMGEITVILLLALIFLGPSKLPDLASGLGRLIREIRKATSDVKNEIALDDTFRKPFEELRDAITLHPDVLKQRDEMKKAAQEALMRLEEQVKEQVTPPPEALPPADSPVISSAPPPPVVEGPPAGTVGRRDISAPPKRFGPPWVTPPTSSLDSKRANTTQALSEADLLPHLPPAPPPIPGVSTPPPLPGVVKPPSGPKKT